MFSDDLAQMPRQVPGPGHVVANHRMVGVQHAVLDVDQARFVAGVALHHDVVVVREALHHQWYARIVEQAYCVGLVRVLGADGPCDVRRDLGNVRRGVPETGHGTDRLIRHLALDAQAVDDVDDRGGAEQRDCLFNG